MWPEWNNGSAATGWPCNPCLSEAELGALRCSVPPQRSGAAYDWATMDAALAAGG